MLFFFFFNDTATTEIYTLSLHDALPISVAVAGLSEVVVIESVGVAAATVSDSTFEAVCCGLLLSLTRSEEHTSELQSLAYLVCRLLLEKKKRIRDLDRVEMPHT